jgi:tripartite-type tricarboxylate transporter receptor subunit TctC
MKKFAFATFTAVTLLTVFPVQAQQFPSRPIEISAWGAAGGQLDFAMRFLGKALEKELGVGVVVVNRTGGGGGVAMGHVWNKPHDGYSWLGASEGMQNAAVLGFHTTTTKDWRWYLIGGAPAVLGVKADSPFKTYEDFIKAAEAKPGEVSISHCQPGCIFHLKSISLANGTKTQLNLVPYGGSGPAMVAALSGDSDAVMSSVAEQFEYLKSGRLRAIGMAEIEPYTLDGQTIPAIGAEYPGIMEIPVAQYSGFAVPVDAPKAVLGRIDAAFEKVMQDEEVVKTFRDRRIELWSIYGDAAAQKLLKMESGVGWKLFELGITKISPDTLGIAKP